MTNFFLNKLKIILVGFATILIVALFKVYLGGGFNPFTLSNFIYVFTQPLSIYSCLGLSSLTLGLRSLFHLVISLTDNNTLFMGNINSSGHKIGTDIRTGTGISAGAKNTSSIPTKISENFNEMSVKQKADFEDRVQELEFKNKLDPLSKADKEDLAFYKEWLLDHANSTRNKKN